MEYIREVEDAKIGIIRSPEEKMRAPDENKLICRKGIEDWISLRIKEMPKNEFQGKLEILLKYNFLTINDINKLKRTRAKLKQKENSKKFSEKEKNIDKRMSLTIKSLESKKKLLENEKSRLKNEIANIRDYPVYNNYGNNCQWDYGFYNLSI